MEIIILKNSVFFKSAFRIGAVALLCLVASPAFAHVGGHASMSFNDGFWHPISGLDHFLAMIAVGIWAAQMKGNAKWLLPLTFPLMMIAGALPAFLGMPIPGVEVGIAASVLVLGALIAAAVRVPVLGGTGLIALFALMHGAAHGAELPHQASAAYYTAGFILATALLHLVGLYIGLLGNSKAAMQSLRLGGATIAVAGTVLLFNAL